MANEHNSPAGDIEITPPDRAIVTPDSWSATLSAMMSAQDSRAESKRRLNEARAIFYRSEQEHVGEATNAAREIEDQALALYERAEEIRREVRAIEAEADAHVRILKRQAELENRLAESVRDIAERSALSVLDRIKEASDSMMDWAELVADNLGNLMKEEAAGQVSRKISDINAVRDALDDEQRASELLDMAAAIRKKAA